VPKESKRFINPLLRPTVEVETKPEEVQTTQPERSGSPEKTNTSTDTATKTSMEILTAHSVPEPSPVSQPIEPSSSAKKRVAYPSTPTSTFQEETELPARLQTGDFPRSEREVAAGESEVERLEGENMMLYTSSVVPRYRDDQATAPRRGIQVDQPVLQTLMPSSITQPSPFPSTSQTVEWASPPAIPDSPPLPSTSTYISTEQNASSAYTRHDEVVEQEHYSAPPPSRRRRGAQAFEKTHERITLWIDKRLKQAFEELAYEQEISKTALLNEAMADLLNKYASR